MNHRKLLLGGSLALIGAATLAGIAAALMPSRFINYDLASTALVVGLYALAMLILASIASSRSILFRVCTVSLAVSMVGFLIEIWGHSILNYQFMELNQKSTLTTLFLGLLLAHRMLIAPMRTPGTPAIIMKRTALVSAGVLFLLSIIGIMTEGFGRFDEIAVRLMLVSAVIVIGSTIAVGLIALLAPKPGDDEPGLLAGSIGVELTCPRCQHPIEARSNRETRCEGCRLKVRVEVEEPRCACGYLLYQLESDICPECGKPVDPDDRWQPSTDPAPA